MTGPECVQLVKFINARCPSMKLDDETPDAWFIDLRHHDVTDATEAAWAISRRQAYVSLHELLAETEAIQRHRQGRERQAQLEQQLAVENPPLPAADRAKPLRALMAGSPLKAASRPNWQQRRALPARSAKPPLTDAELEAARALLAAHPTDAVRPTGAATPDGATATRSTGGTP